MSKMIMNNPRKEKFLKKYRNLSSEARTEVCVTIGIGPLSWNAAWLEIEHNTSHSEDILKELIILNII